MYKYISKKKKRKTSCTGGHKQGGRWSWDWHLVTTPVWAYIHLQFQEESLQYTVWPHHTSHNKVSETKLGIYILEPNTCKYFSKKWTRKSGSVATDHVGSLGMRFPNYQLVFECTQIHKYFSKKERRKSGCTKWNVWPQNLNQIIRTLSWIFYNAYNGPISEQSTTTAQGIHMHVNSIVVISIILLCGMYVVYDAMCCWCQISSYKHNYNGQQILIMHGP